MSRCASPSLVLCLIALVARCAAKLIGVDPVAGNVSNGRDSPVALGCRPVSGVLLS